MSLALAALFDIWFLFAKVYTRVTNASSYSGEVPLFEPYVSGTDILLGTFYFDGPSSGPIGQESIYLGPLAGDYGIFGEEGLLGATALMPNNPTSSTIPIPEPVSIFLIGFGIVALVGFKNKFREK